MIFLFFPTDVLILRVNHRGLKSGTVTAVTKKVFHSKNACNCRDSEISSSVGALKSRMKDYDTGMESGDDLEEEDFSL